MEKLAMEKRKYEKTTSKAGIEAAPPVDRGTASTTSGLNKSFNKL
jgi:hypothetical protein